MKVFKADLWEGFFLDLEIGKLSSECSPRWKGDILFHPPPFLGSKRLRFPECFKHNSWNVQHPQRGNPKIGSNGPKPENIAFQLIDFQRQTAAIMGI